MATGPEANLWRAMRSNLPEGSFAERIENRHGGGIADVLLVWGVITSLIELKAPRTISRKSFETVSICDHKENPAAPGVDVKGLNIREQGSAAEKQPDVNTLHIQAAKILRPEQVAFHARVLRSGGLSFILARPQDTKILELFCPALGPAAPGQSPAAPGQSPAAPGQSPAAPGQSPAAPGQSPAAPGPRLEALRLPDEGPALRLQLVAQARAWPDLFEALRLRACDHISRGFVITNPATPDL
jgi:hypothetical protein